MVRDYQMCTRCVMDTTDPEIVFDDKGQCNHCTTYFEKEKKMIVRGKEGEEKLKKLMEQIKEKGKGRKYDSLIGLSGGVDSSYIVFLAKKYGLRPLLLHIDNCYNTEIANKNIDNVVKATNFEIYRYDVNWEEFLDLQLAYLKSGVMDLEAPTDMALGAILYDVTDRHGIKTIVSGINFTTEGIMPRAWGWRHDDVANLKDIYRKYGTKKLREYPMASTFKKRFYYMHLKGIRFATPLNYIDYDKEQAKATIKKELGWKDYGLKHGESIYTRFYQFYILPTRFNVDKRKPHLSTLICSGQIRREEALKELKKPLYTKEQFEADKTFVLEKMGISEEEFEEYMHLPLRHHRDFKSDQWLFNLLRTMKRAVSPA